MSNGRGADGCVDCVGFEPDHNLLDRVKAVISLKKGSPGVIETCLSAGRWSGVVSALGV